MLRVSIKLANLMYIILYRLTFILEQVESTHVHVVHRRSERKCVQNCRYAASVYCDNDYRPRADITQIESTNVVL